MDNAHALVVASRYDPSSIGAPPSIPGIASASYLSINEEFIGAHTPFI
jgi:hypothetical protein